VSAPPKVYTIPAGIAFADALAAGVMAQAGDPLTLAATTILLPTRRAVRAMTDAFLRVNDGKALLLPRLLALADIDGDFDGLGADDIPAAIDPLERRLILAQLVMHRPGAFSVAPDQAIRLADALADLIDETESEQIDFAGLANLAPETFAEHWQKTIEFLAIVTENWPAILASRGAIDPARRRVLALTACAEAWKTGPPEGPMIAAGFIAADPALADFIGTVAHLPLGSVVLPGLDRDLDNEAWDAVEPTHPQWGLKTLLTRIGVARDDVQLWAAVPHAAVDALAPRRRLLSAALLPAETTAAWPGLRIDPTACGGLARVDCQTIGDEAEIIALAMRQALETPQRTAALVTPDRNLARRVAAALQRWGIAVDDSAGQPLGETPVGVWLTLVAEAAVEGFAPRPLLALLKHPYAAAGASPATTRRRVRTLERLVLRGPRPAAGLDGLCLALDQIPAERFIEEEDDKEAIRHWLVDLAARTAPLTGLFRTGTIGLADLLIRHAEVAEALADTPEEAGGLRLWRGDDGVAAADLFARLAGPAGDNLPDIKIDRYPAILSVLMEGIIVRPLYGAHPRLAIWGLIEARLQSADLTILGGLNEGTWPPLPGDEPWMSRPMRASFGLPPLEARIGAAVQDFALAAARPEVLMTRATRVDGAPSVPARFLSRLETLLAASKLEIPKHNAASWRAWAEDMDRPADFVPWLRPDPRPPYSVRPRRLSVTAIETWRRDPYAHYARRILRLKPLDPLDADPSASERGQFVHDALDQFIQRNMRTLPDDALNDLIRAGHMAFADAIGHPAVAAFWWPRFERVAAWFIDFERARRRGGAFPIATEIKGVLTVETAGADFVLEATADRIDRLPDGRLAIIDYKTGKPPAPKSVSEGAAPQLPLEAVIAEHGKFPGIAAASVGELAYLRLSGGTVPGEFLPALGREAPEPAIADAWDKLVALIDLFDDPAMPYRSTARGIDYDHLARVQEWMLGA
jgi:ATP-dependent helicase/nuclease subunit B